MKDNIKNKLIEAANKEQINDYSDDIIRKVDTSKVFNPVPTRKKQFNFAPLIFVGATACTLAVVVGVSIGLNIKKPASNNPGGNDIVNPTHIYSEETKAMLSMVSTQESYNIINIANSLKTVKIDNQTIGTGMSAEIEEALVGDFNPFIYNIEAMYKLDEAVVSTVSNNENELYNYSKDLKVLSPYYEYHLYYNEVITEQKNINQPNYSEKSTLIGVIVCDEDVFEFETLKTVKNGNVTTVNYDSKIYISEEKYVDVNSKFKYTESDQKSDFIYDYNYHDGDVSKDVYLEQKIDADGNTTKVYFKSRNKTFDLEITPNVDNTLNCKIKSRGTDPFTAKKNADDKSHTYTFVSGNTYTM